jgi:hypothetical protein
VPWYATPGTVSQDHTWEQLFLPLRKNCWPSAKNFSPLTEMVGMARTVYAKHAANAAPKSEEIMMMLAILVAD